MSLNLVDLESVRGFMLSEIEGDIKNSTLYLSPRLLDKELYADLLKKSVAGGDDNSLASDLLKNRCIKNMETRSTKSGIITVRVPVDAHLTLAEGEFNRFYIRGLCNKAIKDGNVLEVYRAKPVLNPRPQSEALIGKTVDPQKLLADLRKNIGVEPALGLPAGPNSGISVKIK